MTQLDPLYFTPEATFTQIVELMQHKGSFFVPTIEELDLFESDSKCNEWYNIYWNKLNALLACYPKIFKSPLPYLAVLKELRAALEILERVDTE